ncbi:MAG: TonB-dependent receptor [Bdellovibrionales bacterium]|nr:TonB-dependent receptor [Bdellovibrionales bacterium]
MSFIFKKLLPLTLCLLFCISMSLLDRDEVRAESFPEDLTEVGLNQLLNMDLVVTLPGRKEQQAGEAASAIYVISQQDIRDAGITNVAEAFRLVPGMNVARVGANRWAISVRGFNQVFANKLLVLIDGVSIFSPLTNGVIWESNELLLEDIERIEVIRGPGAALWGSNAVNGVINIITKHTKDTLGWLTTLGGGTHEKGFGSLRYGGQISEGTAYRLYTSGHERDEQELESGGGAGDQWESYGVGGRIDSNLTDADKIVISVDHQYQSDRVLFTAPTLEPPFVDSESFKDKAVFHATRVMGLWRHSTSNGSDVQLRSSYTRKARDAKLVSFDYDIYTLDAQHDLELTEASELVYGAALRYFENESVGSYAHEVDPQNRSTTLASGFLQIETELVPGRLRLIYGTKLEHHDLTGFELMPNARMLYNPTRDVTLWSAISRATSEPAIFFEDTKIPLVTVPIPESPLPGLVTSYGSRALEPETLIAYETGLRSKLGPEASVDLAFFYNDYDNVFSLEPLAPSPASVLSGDQMAIELPYIFANDLAACSWGSELSLEWQPVERWRGVFSYSYLNLEARMENSMDLANAALIEGASPAHQFGARSHLKVSGSTSFDTFLRYVDNLSSGNVDAYFELDLQLAYQLFEGATISVVGQNLLHDSHKEFETNLFGTPANEIERGVYGKLTFSY